jgi:neutral ceramidase
MPDRELRAGAAALNVDPPLGLPMMGVVRRVEPARARAGALEVTALALDDGEQRVVLCGVDTLAIQSPEIDEIRRAVVAATGASLAGVLINFGHTHHAPAGGRTHFGAFGEPDAVPEAAVFAYVDSLRERIVEVCRLACERLEPAAVRWALGSVDLAINRRERDPDGQVRRLGWHEQGMLDQSVPVLQALRRDGSAIATLVAYGCHTVTAGVELLAYSPDYPGPLRAALRRWTGGEAIFFLGAAGNVMPRVSFEETGEATRQMGELIALEALHAISAWPGWPAALVEEDGFRTATAVAAFRWRALDAPAQTLAAVERSVSFPLQPAPSLAEIVAEVAKAAAQGRPESELRVLRFHGFGWTRRIEAEVRSGDPRRAVSGTINAVRIGDGVIATGPGEIFTEIGLAVKERSPAAVTLYAGYTNGAISYFPIASEYALGGYEPTYGNKTYGLPSQVDAVCDRLLVQTAVELVRELFPETDALSVPGWLASGRVPQPPARAPIHRPSRPAQS